MVGRVVITGIASRIVPMVRDIACPRPMNAPDEFDSDRAMVAAAANSPSDTVPAVSPHKLIAISEISSATLSRFTAVSVRM
jgi:hypothetical protein